MSNETKWTRGPWEVAPQSATYEVTGEAGERLRDAGLNTQVVMISVGTRSGQVAAIPLDESSIENASLIAEAPNLYDQLADLVNSYENMGGLLELAEKIRASKAALAKARGEKS